MGLWFAGHCIRVFLAAVFLFFLLKSSQSELDTSAARTISKALFETHCLKFTQLQRTKPEKNMSSLVYHVLNLNPKAHGTSSNNLND